MNKSPLPERLLAFDFGMKRIGIAVGQSITQTASALETIQAKAGIPEWRLIRKLIEKWRPDALVVGIPLNMDGTEQSITKNARRFAENLKKEFNLPVYEIDERLTTKDAREQLFAQGGYRALQDGRVDSFAAQLILQNWFEENNR